MTPVVFNLKALRRARGLTQAQLANRLGVRRATVADLERGVARQDTLDLIDRLCAALKCEPGQLFVRLKGRRMSRS